MKHNLKTINKALNEYAKSRSYDNPGVIRVEFSRFAAIHKAQRGRNGVGELVSLQTSVIEADSIHVDLETKYGSTTVYVNGSTRGSHGFGSEGGTFLRLRDGKGKYHSVTVAKRWEREDIQTGALERVFGDETPCEFAPEEFKEYLEEHRKNVVKLVKAEGGETEEVDTWAMRQLRRDFSKRFYQELISYELDDCRHTDKFDRLVQHVGGSVVVMFRYTDSFRTFSPDYVDVNANGFEIGWMSRDTYNSLPMTLRVTKTREIKTVKLSDLDVEAAGYYAHSDQMRILPEQVKEVKKFAARYRAKQRQVIAATVRNARKAG